MLLQNRVKLKAWPEKEKKKGLKLVRCLQLDRKIGDYLMRSFEMSNAS